MYGDIPGSRWGHRLVSNEHKIMLFGGMNLSNYCESVFHDILIDDGAIYDYLMKPAALKLEQQAKEGKKGLELSVDSRSSRSCSDRSEFGGKPSRQDSRHGTTLSRYNRLTTMMS